MAQPISWEKNEKFTADFWKRPNIAKISQIHKLTISSDYLQILVHSLSTHYLHKLNVPTIKNVTYSHFTDDGIEGIGNCNLHVIGDRNLNYYF